VSARQAGGRLRPGYGAILGLDWCSYSHTVKAASAPPGSWDAVDGLPAQARFLRDVRDAHNPLAQHVVYLGKLLASVGGLAT
jgi:hypothetical protein